MLCMTFVFPFFILTRADYFEDEAIQHVLKYKPWWIDAHKKMTALQRESHQEHDTQTLGENIQIWTHTLLDKCCDDMF